MNTQGTGVAAWFGNGRFGVNGVGLTQVNALRGGRSYDVPAVSTYGSVYPSYGHSTYGSVYPSHGYSSLYNGGQFPSSYGTYRLIRPAPVAGTYGTTYGPVYGNKYAHKYSH